MSDEFDDLIDDAEASLESIEGRVDDLFDGDPAEQGGFEAVADELGADDLETILGDVDDLVEILDEVEDVLDAVDLTELPEAVDAGELLEAIETGEIPEIVEDEDRELGDAVELRQLFRAIELTELWEAANVRELWQAKRELGDAVDDVSDSGEDDGGLVEEAADAVTGDEDDGGIGDLLDSGADDRFGSDVDAFEGGLDADLGSGFADGDSALADGDLAEYQTIIQQQAMAGIDEFRAAILETHAKFQRLYEFNRERMRRENTATDSRNPTAASTMPTVQSAVGSTERHSTVPRETKYSTAPNRKRIYGRRFERELERRRGETDE